MSVVNSIDVYKERHHKMRGITDISMYLRGCNMEGMI